MGLLSRAVAPLGPFPEKKQARSLLVVLVTLAFAVSNVASGQRGAITMPRTLSDLTALADRIVQGRVVSARVEPDPNYKNLKTLLISLQVEDVLKGDSIKTLTFRQFIWDLRDISDAAGYHVGDEVVLFLNRPTSIGLTSPVGLEQGRFRVARSATGRLLALNGNGNAGLLNGLMESGVLNPARLSGPSRTEVLSFKQGAISLSTLKESTRAVLQNTPRPR